MRLALVVALVALTATDSAQAQTDRARLQTTTLISRAKGGGIPNGASTNAVVSGDRRFARYIAFQSTASNITANDANHATDVFVVRRRGHLDNAGTQWQRGATRRASNSRRGGAPNGPSYAPVLDGSLDHAPKCVAFLSDASNLVAHDTNHATDAFVTRLGRRGARAHRISLPHQRQSTAPATEVAISGDCSRIAFTAGGSVWVRARGRTRRVGRGEHPSFSTGIRNDLVYSNHKGVFLSRNATQRPRLVAPGGQDPAFNDVRRRVVAYEKHVGGHWQVMFRVLGSGRPERAASARYGSLGNGDSRDPVIGNSGYYIAFETDASNLGVNSLSRRGDYNRRPDAYLYTDVRALTLVQSVSRKAVPLSGGGRRPSMSFYANYFLFDSSWPLGSRYGTEQVWMRYLGPV